MKPEARHLSTLQQPSCKIPQKPLSRPTEENQKSKLQPENNLEATLANNCQHQPCERESGLQNNHSHRPYTCHVAQ